MLDSLPRSNDELESMIASHLCLFGAPGLIVNEAGLITLDGWRLPQQLDLIGVGGRRG